MEVVAILVIIVLIAALSLMGLALYLRKKRINQMFQPVLDQFGNPINPPPSPPTEQQAPQEYRKVELPPMIRGK